MINYGLCLFRLCPYPHLIDSPPYFTPFPLQANTLIPSVFFYGWTLLPIILMSFVQCIYHSLSLLFSSRSVLDDYVVKTIEEMKKDYYVENEGDLSFIDTFKWLYIHGHYVRGIPSNPLPINTTISTNIYTYIQTSFSFIMNDQEGKKNVFFII